MIFVGVGDPVQARRDFTEVMVVYTYITTGRNEQGMVLFEPCLGLADRAIERQAPPFEEENPVADLERQGRPLLGEQHSRTAVTGEPQGQLDQPLGGLWVELRRRLVEKQELRLECQRRSEADALQLAARELGHEPPRQMLCADPGEGVERARFDLLCRGADVLEAERDLVEDAGEDDLVLGVLEEGRNGAGQARRAMPPGVEAGDLDPPGEPAAVEVRDESREGAEQRRLAGAGRAEYQRDLSRGQTRGHVPKSRDL